MKKRRFWTFVIIGILLMTMQSTYASEENNTIEQQYGDMAKGIEERIDMIKDTSSLKEKDSNKSEEESIITPQYEPIHDCHSGPGHQNCRVERYPESCGCEIGYIRCCCGMKMGVYQDWCSEHGY